MTGNLRDNYYVESGEGKSDRLAFRDFNEIRVNQIPINCEGILILLGLQYIQNIKVDSNELTVDLGKNRNLVGSFAGQNLQLNFNFTIAVSTDNKAISIRQEELLSIKRIVKKKS